MPDKKHTTGRSHIRNLIKAEEMVVKLQKYALGDDNAALGRQQISAIKLLLNKVLPDIKAIEVSGEEGQAIQHNLQVEFIDD